VEIASQIEPASAWRKMMDAGMQIDEIHREGGGLEDFYMAVTEAKEAA
jgi:hypothetical protein